MKALSALGFVVIAAVLVLAGGPFYIVQEFQQVIITQFGQPIGTPITEAGLHMKMPYVQQANYFEKRLLEWDGERTQIPTKDKKFILIDETARWRIKDPLLFFQSVGNVRGALERLNGVIASATRDVITNHILQELVRSSNRLLDQPRAEGDKDVITVEEVDPIKTGRTQLTRLVLARASELTPEYGIELVDMRIKRINYVEEVREKVYERMISERKRAAEQYRSEGQGKRAEVEGEMEKELKRITSGAYRTSQEIIGKADAETTGIYAAAYNKDPDFYTFLKTLETYRQTVDPNTTIIMTTESDYYKFLKKLP